MAKLSITLIKKYKSFEPTFTGYNIEGDLIILTGVNGSGKSQFLDIIHQKDKFLAEISTEDKVRTTRSTNAQVTLDGKMISSDRIRHTSFKKFITIQELTTVNNDNFSKTKKRIWELYRVSKLDYKKSIQQAGHPGQTPDDPSQYTQVCKEIKAILIQQHGESKFSSLSEEQVKAFIPPSFVMKKDDIFTNCIGEIFYSHLKDLDQKHIDASRAKTSFDETAYLEKAPWKILNSLFEELDFEYRFKDNYTLKNEEINEQPKLFAIRLNSDGKKEIDETQSRSLKELSDGEKAIISLSFASFNQDAKDTKILLLDEYDATFNPSLTEAFFKILNIYFIQKGITVVLTTHRTDTLMLSPPETKIYTISKPNGGLERLQLLDKSKYTEYKKVHDKHLAENQNFKIQLEDISTKLRLDSVPYVITEGKTDATHLKTAIQRLPYDISLEFHDSKEPLGETKLESLLKDLAKVPQKRPIIGIFDRDNLDFITKIGDHKAFGNNVFAFCIPTPPSRKDYQNISIEFYYTDDELKTQNEGKRLYFDNEVEFRQSGNKKSRRLRPLSLEDREESSELVKKVFDDKFGDETWIHSKSVFAQLVETNPTFAANFNFDNFKLILDKIRSTVNLADAQTSSTP